MLVPCLAELVERGRASIAARGTPPPAGGPAGHLWAHFRTLVRYLWFMKVRDSLTATLRRRAIRDGAPGPKATPEEAAEEEEEEEAGAGSAAASTAGIRRQRAVAAARWGCRLLAFSDLVPAATLQDVSLSLLAELAPGPEAVGLLAAHFPDDGDLVAGLKPKYARIVARLEADRAVDLEPLRRARASIGVRESTESVRFRRQVVQRGYSGAFARPADVSREYQRDDVAWAFETNGDPEYAQFFGTVARFASEVLQASPVKIAPPPPQQQTRSASMAGFGKPPPHPSRLATSSPLLRISASDDEGRPLPRNEAAHQQKAGEGGPSEEGRPTLLGKIFDFFSGAKSEGEVGDDDDDRAAATAAAGALARPTHEQQLHLQQHQQPAPVSPGPGAGAHARHEFILSDDDHRDQHHRAAPAPAPAPSPAPAPAPPARERSPARISLDASPGRASPASGEEGEWRPQRAPLSAPPTLPRFLARSMGDSPSRRGSMSDAEVQSRRGPAPWPMPEQAQAQAPSPGRPGAAAAAGGPSGEARASAFRDGGGIGGGVSMRAIQPPEPRRATVAGSTSDSGVPAQGAPGASAADKKRELQRLASMLREKKSQLERQRSGPERSVAPPAARYIASVRKEAEPELDDAVGSLRLLGESGGGGPGPGQEAAQEPSNEAVRQLLGLSPSSSSAAGAQAAGGGGFQTDSGSEGSARHAPGLAGGAVPKREGPLSLTPSQAEGDDNSASEGDPPTPRLLRPRAVLAERAEGHHPQPPVMGAPGLQIRGPRDAPVTLLRPARDAPEARPAALAPVQVPQLQAQLQWDPAVDRPALLRSDAPLGGAGGAGGGRPAQVPAAELVRAMQQAAAAAPPSMLRPSAANLPPAPFSDFALDPRRLADASEEEEVEAGVVPPSAAAQHAAAAAAAEAGAKPARAAPAPPQARLQERADGAGEEPPAAARRLRGHAGPTPKQQPRERPAGEPRPTDEPPPRLQTPSVSPLPSRRRRPGAGAEEDERAAEDRHSHRQQQQQQEESEEEEGEGRFRGAHAPGGVDLAGHLSDLKGLQREQIRLLQLQLELAAGRAAAPAPASASAPAAPPAPREPAPREEAGGKKQRQHPAPIAAVLEQAFGSAADAARERWKRIARDGERGPPEEEPEPEGPASDARECEPPLLLLPLEELVQQQHQPQPAAEPPPPPPPPPPGAGAAFLQLRDLHLAGGAEGEEVGAVASAPLDAAAALAVPPALAAMPLQHFPEARTQGGDGRFSLEEGAAFPPPEQLLPLRQQAAYLDVEQRFETWRVHQRLQRQQDDKQSVVRALADMDARLREIERMSDAVDGSLAEMRSRPTGPAFLLEPAGAKKKGEGAELAPAAAAEACDEKVRAARELLQQVEQEVEAKQQQQRRRPRARAGALRASRDSAPRASAEGQGQGRQQRGRSPAEKDPEARARSSGEERPAVPPGPPEGAAPHAHSKPRRSSDAVLYARLKQALATAAEVLSVPEKA
eukprot:tig00020800_g13735.t1